jgi:hypothetical protein
MKKTTIIRIRMKIQQIGLAMFFFGLAFLINRYTGGKLLTSGGLLLYALSRIIRAFEPIYREPFWELVFPELALGAQDPANESETTKNDAK